jgi:hypothetical protein
MPVLDRAQLLDDILPLDAAVVGVDPASTRYHGEWDGHDIYFALGTDNIVYVISIPVDDPAAWSAVSTS